MEPNEYFYNIVEPTVAEFLSRPEDKRLAFLACVVVLHLRDCLAAARGEVGCNVAMRDLLNVKYYALISDIGNIAKHIELDPTRPVNRERHLIRQNDLHVGGSAAFSDGTYFSDGTGFSDARPVMRITIEDGRVVDLSYALRTKLDACKAYFRSEGLLG